MSIPYGICVQHEIVFIIEHTVIYIHSITLLCIASIWVLNVVKYCWGVTYNYRLLLKMLATVIYNAPQKLDR